MLRRSGRCWLLLLLLLPRWPWLVLLQATLRMASVILQLLLLLRKRVVGVSQVGGSKAVVSLWLVLLLLPLVLLLLRLPACPAPAHSLRLHLGSQVNVLP